MFPWTQNTSKHKNLQLHVQRFLRKRRFNADADGEDEYKKSEEISKKLERLNPNRATATRTTTTTRPTTTFLPFPELVF